MSVLILKNVASEGPGTIEVFLRETHLPYRIVDMYEGAQAPTLEGIDHLIIMGGPMAVYEMAQHPFLRGEASVIEKAIASNLRVLGVCLGAQMVAHALGARVYAGARKEVGWYEVGISDEGMKDDCLKELSIDGRKAAQVFQWHGDTFDLPQGAVRLASSDLYQNQAFRFADNVYALQFHIEVTPQIVTNWLKHEKSIDFNAISSESERIYDSYRIRAWNFYKGFFRTAITA